jgi:pimeloyl-ACP methyl ester carboxylesterase
MTGQPRPFTIEIPESHLTSLKSKLALTRFPEKETVDDWDQGIPLSYVKELAAYWATKYDWRRCEAALNALPNFLIELDGLDIHFIHVRSANPEARPLLLTHGWPGSVLEFMNVIGPLSEDYHLVIPSLPGYAFSGKPTEAGWGVDRIAKVWNDLMLALGYTRYFAQGGDWGSAVTSEIGAQNLGACAGIHINMVIGALPDPMPTDLTPSEMSALQRLGWYQEKDTGYSIQQATRPQTLGYGLADSPVGQMAWIIEKFHGWTDCDGHPENAVSRDHLLDNVMLYWLTNSAASSARLYWHSFRTFRGGAVSLPTGCSIFPMEIFRMSRRWVEGRYTNITHWNELPKGGHFAAMEQPEAFVAELKACFGGMTL